MLTCCVVLTMNLSLLLIIGAFRKPNIFMIIPRIHQNSFTAIQNPNIFPGRKPPAPTFRGAASNAAGEEHLTQDGAAGKIGRQGKGGEGEGKGKTTGKEDKVQAPKYIGLEPPLIVRMYIRRTASIRCYGCVIAIRLSQKNKQRLLSFVNCKSRLTGN